MSLRDKLKYDGMPYEACDAAGRKEIDKVVDTLSELEVEIMNIFERNCY